MKRIKQNAKDLGRSNQSFQRAKVKEQPSRFSRFKKNSEHEMIVGRDNQYSDSRRSTHLDAEPFATSRGESLGPGSYYGGEGHARDQRYDRDSIRHDSFGRQSNFGRGEGYSRQDGYGRMDQFSRSQSERGSSYGPYREDLGSRNSDYDDHESYGSDRGSKYQSRHENYDDYPSSRRLGAREPSFERDSNNYDNEDDFSEREDDYRQRYNENRY